MGNEVATTAKTAVAKKQKTVADIFTSDKFKVALTEILPKGMDVARFIAIGNQQVRRNPAVMNCTPISVYNCMMQSARLGVFPDGRNAYLIPYGNECTLQFDYKGWVDLLIRNGIVTKVYADVICENDDYEFDMGELKHHHIRLGSRGKIVGAYAIAYLPDGNRQTEIIEVDEIEEIRSKSRNANRGPWVDFYREMCKKVVFKRLTKWLKVTPDILDAMENDNKEFDFGKSVVSASVQQSAVKPANPSAPTNRIAALEPEEDDEPVTVEAEVVEPPKAEPAKKEDAPKAKKQKKAEEPAPAKDEDKKEPLASDPEDLPFE